MKRLEDLENLNMQELERIASDESIRIPGTLKHDIAVTARALEMASANDATTGSRRKRRLAMYSYPAAAVAILAIGMSITFRSTTPKDTFEDPYMAYVQMEQVFGFISEKMNSGLDIANAVEPVIDKTIKAIR